MSVVYFGDRLVQAVRQTGSQVVVGLDPSYDLLPPEVRDAYSIDAYQDVAGMKAACYREFLRGILDGVATEAVAVKIQLAYFEALGAAGYELYEELVASSKDRGLLVIADAKRGDIGSTAEAYATAHLDRADADAMTVNPYLGTDSLEPFVRRTEEAGKGVFVLVKTSNPSSADVQDLELVSGERLYHRIAGLVSQWGEGTRGDDGYSSVGAVVGGTHPKEGAVLRALMPGVPFLVPGYGAQGAGPKDLAGFFDAKGLGAVVNSSRAILYAYRRHTGMSWQDAARKEAGEMRQALRTVSGLE